MTDWDLGQKLIEQGACSLDQVREALSIQDRMKQMGVVPKPLPEILLEKGYVTAEQLAGTGVSVPARKAAPRPASSRPSAPRRYQKKKSPAPWFVLAAVAGLVLIGIVFGGDILKALNPEKAPVARPKPVTGPSPSEVADTKAGESLDRIDAFASGAEDFENGAEVIKRYEAFMATHRGRKWELEGQKRLAAYRERADAFARPKLDALLARDEELRADGRLGELLALYKAFPAKFLDLTDSGRIVRQRIGELEAKIAESFVKDKADVERLARAKKYREALLRLVAMKKYATAGRLGEVGELQIRIERERRAETATLRRELRDEYFRVDGEFKKALHARTPRVAVMHVAAYVYKKRPAKNQGIVQEAETDFAELKAAIDAWEPEKIATLCEAAAPEADSPGTLSVSQTAILDLRSAALVALFLRDFATAFQKASADGDLLDLPGLGKGKFRKDGNSTVFITDSGDVLRPDTHPVSDRDRVVLAMKGKPEDASHHARVGFFYYYCSRGRFILAYEHLKRARELKGRGLGPYLSTLLPAARRERELLLTTKLDAARESFKKNQWVTARKLLEEMVREYEEHAITKQNRPEIEKMLFEISEGLAKEKKLKDLYRAPVEWVDSRTLRVTYDFEDRGQLDAFEVISAEGERKFKGRWKITRGALESAYDASVIRWKTRVRGNVVLEYHLTPVEDPQNIVLDLYFNKGESKHYAFYLGFDWVGKRDDPKNTVEDRYGMPRTCVIKYPVAVDYARWVLKDHWANWTARLVGQGQGSWKPEKRKAVKMKVERRGRAIRIFADGKPVWEGEDGDYIEGDLLFYSDSRCTIDNLSITFNP